MPKPKARWINQAEYVPLRALLSFLQALPITWSRAFCRQLIRGLLRFIPKRRRLIAAQISACFSNPPPSRVEEIARQSADCLGDGLATFARIPHFSRKELSDLIETRGFEHIDEAYRQGRGMITFTAHYGCWELMAVYVTMLYPRVSMLVRPFGNPFLDGMITRVRESGGGGVIDSRRVFRDGLRLLRSNGILGILVDQNFYKGGVFVDFFGRPAATSTLVPILARRTGCAVLPMHNYWRDGKLHILCEPPLALSQSPDASEAIAHDTQAITSVVEGWIREDPGQWLWLHNRWKRRPQPGDPIYTQDAGLRQSA